MNPVCREEEINEIPSQTFTFLSKKEIPSSSSGEAAIDFRGRRTRRRRKGESQPSSKPKEEEEIIYDQPMNPIGGFREGEIDGQPFHLFNFLSQIESLPLFQPLFICQSFCGSNRWFRRREYDPNRNEFLPVDVSPRFFNKRSGDEQFQFLIGSDIYHHPCKLPLSLHCNEGYLTVHCSLCPFKLATDFYFCDTCQSLFHKECIECPLEIKHPSFPFLSLKLYYPPETTYMDMLSCFSCEQDIRGIHYYCPTNKLLLHPVCAMKPIPILIDHPKRHPHPLTFFPKQNSLPCDACGLIKELIPTYVCARCVFVVHEDCVYHPYVIKISRHNHRISFTSSLPSGEWFCGVCRRKVNNKFGAYSCNKCGNYFVHTKCALRRDLWDGEELERVPEEPEMDDEPPFKWICDGIILHFSHYHHLKLEINRVYNEEKFCQACMLPIYEGNYYSCVGKCEFILHEECANAPRRKHHPLNARPLTLKVINNPEYNMRHFSCEACRRDSRGFVYGLPRQSWGFMLDVRCSLVYEPFLYEGHKHPLFLALTPEEKKSAICQICQEEGDKTNNCQKLTCIECNYIICFRCATLPYKAMYKHDKHLLTFRKKEEASIVDHSGWCDRCERKLVYSRKGGFYSCDDYCSTTLHVDCLLGKNPYLKPGGTYSGGRHDILGNNTMSRPFCHTCKDRCQDKVVFKRENKTICSISCLHNFKG